MSDLNVDDGALLEEARDTHEPTEHDRARVRRALLLRLGVGTGLVSTTAATSKAATVGLFTKVIAAVAIAGAIGGTGVVAYRAAKPEPSRVATVPAVGISQGGALKPAAPASPPQTPALSEPPATEPTHLAVGRPVPSIPRNGAPPILESTIALTAPSVARAKVAEAPPATDSPGTEAPVVPSTHSAPPGSALAGSATGPTALLSPTTLEAETRLVRAGVDALHGGDPARALALFDEHLRAFPNGALAEERSAERVIALDDLRRCDEARSAAAAFVREYPHSPLVTRVRESCNGAANP